MTPPSDALRRIAAELSNDPIWADRFDVSRREQRGIHLAVFREPYLSYVLDGSKTVESRFSTVRCPPFRRVGVGDVVVLKRAAGPVLGVCEVATTWYYEIDPTSWRTIRRDFAKALCATDAEFWDQRKGAAYATLLRIQNVRPVPPTAWPKRDRRGWVVVRERAPRFALGTSMSVVLAVSGGMGSGKSTLSVRLASELGWSRASFGDYVRSVATAKRRSTSRKNLQEIGQQLVEASPADLCAGVLQQALWVPGDSLVIDGLRHPQVKEALEKAVAPSRLLHVHLSVDPTIRAGRLAIDGKDAEWQRMESHAVEHDTENLASSADKVLDGSLPPDEILAQVEAWLGTALA